MFSIQTAASQFVANLSGLEQRMNKTNIEVSSGLRVHTLSDDPDSVSEILQLNAQIAANNQVKTNISRVQTEVNAAESAINTATSLMDRAAEIAAQGSSTESSVDRTQLAQQVKDLLDEMQQLATSQVGGRYIFAGNADQTAPYGPVNLVSNPTNAVGAYNGNASTRSVVDAYGIQISISYTAQDVFDGGPGGTPATSVFQSLTQLYTALAHNNPSAAAAAVGNVKGAANYLDEQQALYGDIQGKIEDALTAQSGLYTGLQAQLSTLQDADMAEAVTQQQTDSTALTAAETAYSAMPKKSLFDYLG